MQNRGFPGGPVVEISPSSARGASSILVGELRFHIPCSQKTKKILKTWEYQTILPASWETCMQVKKQQLELDMEQQIGSK